MSVPDHSPLNRPATVADIGPVARTLAVAFEDTAVTQWLIPDPAQRTEIRFRHFAILVEHAIEHGIVYTASDHSTAMVWLDYTKPVSSPFDYHARIAEAYRPWTDRFEHLNGLFDRHHPTEPHHYLAVGGVHPRHRRTGLQTAQLETHLKLLDQHQINAYSEISNPVILTLAKRHGYHIMTEPFTLPNGTQLWPVWRPPR